MKSKAIWDAEECALLPIPRGTKIFLISTPCVTQRFRESDTYPQNSLEIFIVEWLAQNRTRCNNF